MKGRSRSRLAPALAALAERERLDASERRAAAILFASFNGYAPGAVITARKIVRLVRHELPRDRRRPPPARGAAT